MEHIQQEDPLDAQLVEQERIHFRGLGVVHNAVQERINQIQDKVFVRVVQLEHIRTQQEQSCVQSVQKEHMQVQ